MSIFDCVVIGAGPAGLTASIYLQRANKKIILLEKSSPGGQIIRTNSIENYPGFEKIDGASLAMNMFNQAINIGVKYQYGTVNKIEKDNDLYKITTDIDTYKTKTIIIATGRSARLLGLQNESNLIGRGISFCAICDGYLYKDKDVAVVGAGDSALEESMFLSKICHHVYVFNRSEKMRASDSVQEKLNDIPNIEIINDSIITGLIAENNKLSKIVVNENKTYDVACLFEFIGQIPTKFLIDGLKMENDYIVVNQNMATTLPGIYACGDSIKKDFYQISIAVGEGAIAALNVIKELKK